MTFRYFLESFRIIYDLSELFITFRNILELFRSFQNFSEHFCVQFFCIKILFLSKFLSSMFLNSWNVHKKPKKRRKSRKMALKSVNIHYISSWSNVCLNSKFQAALMFHGWGNCEKTHNFRIYKLQKDTKNGQKNGNLKKKNFLHFFGIKIVFLSKFHSPRCCNGLNFRKKHEKKHFC